MGKALVEGAKRSDMHRVPIAQVVIDHAFNSRRFGHNPDTIRKYAADIAANGQKQPVLVRKDGDGRLLVTAGFGRAEAVKMVNETPELLAKHRERTGEDEMLLLCIYQQHESDKEAFIDNVTENAMRQNTSHIDDAHAQARLRDEYGMTDKEIAELYGQSQAQVWRNKKLLNLTEKEQRLVHEGKLPASTAIHLPELSDEERGQAIANAVAAAKDKGNEHGEVDGTAFAESIRESRQRKGKGLGLTISNVRKFAKSLAESEDNEALARFGKDFLEYLAGKKGEQAMINALDRYAESREMVEA